MCRIVCINVDEHGFCHGYCQYWSIVTPRIQIMYVKPCKGQILFIVLKTILGRFLGRKGEN